MTSTPIVGSSTSGSVRCTTATCCGTPRPASWSRHLEGPGFYYAPTVLAEVAPGMTAFDQEIFGPVAALTTAADRDEAVALANHTEFGLSASVWTSDPTAARQVADALKVGGVCVNRIPVSDPRIPIGGVKKSGFGRDLSHFGVHEFMNAKTLWLE